jgi:hypothetical protein
MNLILEFLNYPCLLVYSSILAGQTAAGGFKKSFPYVVSTIKYMLTVLAFIVWIYL